MTQPQDQQPTDMLTQIFAMQEELNNKTFDKNGIQNQHEGITPNDVLDMESIRYSLKVGDLGPNGLPCIWLRNYLTALEKECEELRAELPWKWWSKDEINMQNIRVEIVDQLHFLVSLAQVAGLDAKELHRLYMAKHAVNNQRQDNGYSQATKNEADNKAIV